jgi:hypothetical protein
LHIFRQGSYLKIILSKIIMQYLYKIYYFDLSMLGFEGMRRET